MWGKTDVKEATRGNWGERWLRNAHFPLLFQHMMRAMDVLSAYV
jgi:hypothetical protein